MHRLLTGSIMAGLCALAAMPANAQPTPGATIGPMVSRGGPMMTRATWVPSWGHRVNGRWWAGWQAPGGWPSYRQPVAGFILPGYWRQPAYRIGDYRDYGLPAPQPGYAWSRYYDDAVLADSYGKVYDSRIDYDWDRYGGYDSDGGYQRTAGRPDVARNDSSSRDVQALRSGNAGTRAERRLAREVVKQRKKLDRMARAAGYRDYDAFAQASTQRTALAAPPSVTVTGSGTAADPRIETRQMPGHVAGGYYYPGETVTTITIDPAAETAEARYAALSPAETEFVRRKVVRSIRSE